MTTSKVNEPAFGRVLDEAAVLAERLVAGGLELAKREQAKRPKTARKAAEGDLVTSADEMVEAAISQSVRQTFPSHGIVGEEGTVVRCSGEWMWRIDPIDGTNNYAYGSPLFGTAVSLHFAGRTVLAAIAHHDTVIVAQERRPLRVVEAGESQAVVAGERDVAPATALWLGYGVDRVGPPLKEILDVLNGAARRNFESWAPTVDTVLYLRGGIDLVVGYRCSGEELRAALFVLASAGAVLKTFEGEDFDPSDPPELFVAGRPGIVAELGRKLSLAIGTRSAWSTSSRHR